MLFHDSHLCICIEYAFGMLVHCWAILCLEISFNITIVKVIALVNALAKLHNFCIEVGDWHGFDESILNSMPINTNNLQRSGLVALDAVNGNGNLIPSQLLGSGHHSNDYPRNEMIWRIRRSEPVLPCTLLTRHVISMELHRPRAIVHC